MKVIGEMGNHGILEMDEGVTFVGNWDGDNFQGTLKTDEFRIEGEWKHHPFYPLQDRRNSLSGSVIVLSLF